MQIAAYAEHGNLQLPDALAERFRKTAAVLAELHQARSDETMRRDIEEPSRPS